MAILICPQEEYPVLSAVKVRNKASVDKCKMENNLAKKTPPKNYGGDSRSFLSGYSLQKLYGIPPKEDP